MKPNSLLPVLLLSLLAGCQGGSGGSDAPRPSAPPPAPAAPARVLHYTNPPATGFRLEADPATNNTPHLVLQLRGPAGLEAGGVAFFVTLKGDQATWVPPSAGSGLFRYEGALGPGIPPLSRARLHGSKLEVGLFTTTQAPVALGRTPLLSLALDVKPQAAPGPVGLVLPKDQGAAFLNGHRVLEPLPAPLGLGTLEVR